ncbi:hypothetical protein L2E82_36083 [Cichorium intybus]|uniref:Uncharacterized protein n=1 Tax=Cichorium intybus TaxID=13427 RepID=A0ACB9BQK3_CICIN|nr:hypothetical protein L2E82_36083 [Cichorium intybus]
MPTAVPPSEALVPRITSGSSDNGASQSTPPCAYRKSAPEICFLLQRSSSISTHRAHSDDPGPSSSEIVQSIKAYKTFSNVSPIPMFFDFTANQVMLEAVDGAMIVHVIDFDIRLGCHQASFMKDIAKKAEVWKVYTSTVRIC